MAQPMSMNTIIHQAIRRDLARFDAALAEFPAGSRARAVRLGTAWRYFFQELDHHHHGEHDIAWPALRAVGVPQALLDDMDAEHERLAGVLASAGDAFDALEKDPSAGNAQAARAAVAELATVAGEHLAHEEREVEPFYQAQRDSAEIKAMGRQFARRNPLKSGDFFAWITNGATPEEQVALRESVPGPVIAIFANVLGQRYRRIVAPVWR
jgi:hemerythrin-like domain-containing protein